MSVAVHLVSSAIDGLLTAVKYLTKVVIGESRPCLSSVTNLVVRSENVVRKRSCDLLWEKPRGYSLRNV